MVNKTEAAPTYAFQRLFSPDLDTVNQAKVMRDDAATWTPMSVPSEVRGALRMSVLMGGRLMLTDTQLFDGCIMTALGADGFAQLVASQTSHDRWPLEVLMRGTDLATSLRGLLVDDRRDAPDESLAGFWFSVLPGDERESVRDNLEMFTVNDLDGEIEAAESAAVGVATLLARAGADPEVARSLGRVWQGWIDAERRFYREQVAMSRLLQGAPPPAARERLRVLSKNADAQVVEAAERLCGDKVVTRSDAYNLLEEIPDAFAEHREGIREWVNDWHQHEVARRMKAVIVRSRAGSPPSISDWRASYELFVSPRIAAELSTMPSEVFSVVAYRTRDHDVSAWWTARERERRRAQRRLAHALSISTDRGDLRRTRINGCFKLFVLLAAVLMAEWDPDQAWVKYVVLCGAALLSVAPEIAVAWSLTSVRLDKVFCLHPREARRTRLVPGGFAQLG